MSTLDSETTRNDNVKSADEVRAAPGSQAYFHGVAQARFAIRKCFRIVDDEARAHGLDPLQHQALIQAYGCADGRMTISELATRLDIVVALASRLVKALVERGYLERTESTTDRRLSYVSVTDEGIALLRGIMSEVEFKITAFQRELDSSEKMSALVILGLYIGVPLQRGDLADLVQADSSTGAQRRERGEWRV